MAFINLTVELKELVAAVAALTGELRLIRLYLVPPPAEDEGPVKKVEMHRLDPVAQYRKEAQEMIERGEDPSMLAYMPPRIGRRE